jgi:hypothetical protein
LNWNQRARLERAGWVEDTGAPDWSALSHVIHLAFEVRGPVDLDAAEMAFDTVVGRHDAFRATFRFRAGEAALEFDAPAPRLTHLPAVDNSRQCSEAFHAALTAPFDLRSGPLARAVIGRDVGSRSWALGFAFEHLIMDGASVAVFLSEFAAAYADVSSGQRWDGGPAPTQMHEANCDEAEWLASPAAAAARAHWHHTLGDTGPWPLLTLERAAEIQGTGLRNSRWHRVELSRALTSSVKRAAVDARVTLYVMCATALSAAVRLHGQGETVGILSPVENRAEQGFSDLIAWQSNMIVHTQRVQDHLPFGEMLQIAREGFLDALTHQRYPIHLLVRELALEQYGRPRLHACLYLDFAIASGDAIRLGNLNVSQLPHPPGAVQPGVGVWVTDMGQAIKLELAHSDGYIPEDLGARLLAEMATILKAIAETPGYALRDLGIGGTRS